MDNKKLLMSVGIFFAALLPAGAASAFSNLEDAFLSALRNDSIFVAAESQYRSVLEKLPQARAGLLPTVNASYNRTGYDAKVEYEDRQFRDINRRYMVDGWTLSVTQPLFRAANLLQYGRAQLQVEQAGTQLEIARNELMVRFSQAFLDWQKAVHAKNAAETTWRHRDAYAKYARSRLNLKLVTVPESLDAEAQLKKAQADLLDAEKGLLVKIAALTRIVGARARAPSFAFKQMPWPELKGTVEQWVERAGDANAQVRYQMFQETMAAKDIQIAKSGHLPSLNLVAGTSKTFNSGSTSIVDGAAANNQYVTNVGIQVEIPIYSGGAVNSRTSEAVALRDKALADLNNARSGAAMDVQAYFYQTEVGALQVEAAEERVRAVQAALDAAKAGQLLNTRMELDVLAAQAELISARKDLFAAQADRMVATLRLRQAAGELKVDDLVVWSSLLTPISEVEPVNPEPAVSVFKLR